MSRRRHFLCLHHDLPCHLAHLGIIESLRTGSFALAAQITGIDHPICHVISHNNGKIVINLPDSSPGIPLILLKIHAALYTFQALALDAAAGFRLGLASVRVLWSGKGLASFHPIHCHI